MDKTSVVRSLIKCLEEQKQEVEASLKEAQASIVDAPGPMQSHSDTTRYQKSILAGSAAESLREKSLAISCLQEILESSPNVYLYKIQVGTLITLLDEEDAAEHYIIVPHCGGVSVEDGRDRITSITPESPLAFELLGKERGSSVTLRTSNEVRHLTIFDLY